MEEMPKNYDPSTNEPAILQKWLDGGYYKRREGVGDCTVTIPPPNVTGKLHMGHATDDSIQDAIIRMARMRGKSTRWVLGTDHAGIATQTKVDKKLKSEGISRLEIGRDKFVDACWDWTHEYGGIIVEQIKRMGCSVDFDNERFTMDEDYAQAVRKVFCDWYHDGLIYRGKRIVNWCPNCTTAISDDEAEYKDEKGHLWHLRYPLTEPVNGQDYIVVATTRPETMLGDTGVAVSPKDPEKAAFVGKTVKLPIVDREIPIFEDWHVDANFGSGFVKVTPAHDPNDYAMGQAHDLPQINIFDEHAVVVEGYGEFTGMTREECREAVIKWFEEHDLLDHGNQYLAVPIALDNPNIVSGRRHDLDDRAERTEALVDHLATHQVGIGSVERIELKVVTICQHVASRDALGGCQVVNALKRDQIAIARIGDGHNRAKAVALERRRRQSDPHTRL